MAKKYAKLQLIDNNEGINVENHYEFLCHLQRSLLLALQERGRLNAMEYRHAEQSLLHQRRDRAKKLLESRERP